MDNNLHKIVNTFSETMASIMRDIGYLDYESNLASRQKMLDQHEKMVTEMVTKKLTAQKDREIAQKDREIAKTLLALGTFTLEQISKVTGLRPKELDELT
jgi:predicted transcriptional regulator YheO